MNENGYAHPHTLVQTDWVAAHQGDPHVRLVEVDVDTRRWQPPAPQPAPTVAAPRVA